MSDNNSNPNSNNNPNNPIKTNINGRQLTEEQAILLTFMKVIRSKFFFTTPDPSSPINEYNTGNINTNKNTGYPDSNAKFQSRLAKLDEIYSVPGVFDAEKKVLMDMNRNGLVKGLCFGFGTFVLLRRGPQILTRIMNRGSSGGGPGAGSSGPNAFPVNQGGFGGGGGYKFDIPAPKGSSNFGAGSGPGPGTNTYKPSFLFRSFKLIVDVTFSITTAMYGTMYFTNYPRLLQDAKSIPLVPGRSIISEELCTDFIDVYRSIPKRTLDKYKDETEKPVAVIGEFVKNCMRRQVVEKELREERKRFGAGDGMGMETGMGFGSTTGTSSSSTDSDKDETYPSIPHPGVSPDIPVEIQWRDMSKEVTVARERDEDMFADQSAGFDQSDLFQESDFRDEFSDRKDDK